MKEFIELCAVLGALRKENNIGTAEIIVSVHDDGSGNVKGKPPNSSISGQTEVMLFSFADYSELEEGLKLEIADVVIEREIKALRLYEDV